MVFLGLGALQLKISNKLLFSSFMKQNEINTLKFCLDQDQDSSGTLKIIHTLSNNPYFTS